MKNCEKYETKILLMGCISSAMSAILLATRSFSADFLGLLAVGQCYSLSGYPGGSRTPQISSRYSFVPDETNLLLAYRDRSWPWKTMEMKATPSTTVRIRSPPSSDAGSEAASTMETAPLIPPREATAFQEFGTLSLPTFTNRRIEYTEMNLAPRTAPKPMAIGTRKPTISERFVARPMVRNATEFARKARIDQKLLRVSLCLLGLSAAHMMP